MRGRLEAVHIEDRISEKCAVGRLGDEKIFVTNGVDHVGKDCIVKFDLLPDPAERVSISNFITSIVPEGFSGLAPSQYILVGKWEHRMEKYGGVPSLKEIDQYFNPGDVKDVYYLRDFMPYRSGGLLKIDSSGRFGRHATISAVIRKYMSDPDVYARVFISEENKLKNVLGRINEFGLVPILMEPLK